MPGAIAPAVGFPTPEDILITKTDFALIIDYVSALRDWVYAVQACIEANRATTFAGTLNSYLSGAR